MLQDKKEVPMVYTYCMFFRYSLPAAIKLFNTCKRLTAGKLKVLRPVSFLHSIHFLPFIHPFDQALFLT